MDVLEKEEVETEIDEISYCHTLCGLCRSSISICGAYKPKICGYALVEIRNVSHCPDCYDLAYEPCPHCRE